MPTSPTHRLASVAVAAALLLAASPVVASPATHRPAINPARAPRVTCEARTDGDRTTPAVAQRYVVASAHPAASNAGCAVLAGRGTAADAAVAVQAVLAVVEPQSSGLAGGTVITYYDRSRDRVRFFDGLARVPGRTTAALRTPTMEEQQQLGVDSFGSDTTYTALAGAIAPALVDRLSQGSYKLNADDGGPAEIPSLMTVDDVADYRAVERDPLCQPVLERWICTAPPPSFGGVAVLSMLEYLERGDVAATAPASLERMHLAIEASRIAQFDRREYVGDPDFQFVPTAGLLDAGYLDRRFWLFSPDPSVPVIEPGSPPDVARPDDGDGTPVPGPHTDADTTSNISIVDRVGDALSMTTTINSSFGAQIEARGMALNNVQENFTRPDSISPGQQVNQMEPDKRPRTSIAPSLVFDRRGRLQLVVGAAGGGAIPDYITQAILGVVVDGMDPQAAINQGHWGGQEITSQCPDIIGARSEVEEGTEVAGLVDDLVALGHPWARLDDLRSGSTAIEVVSPRRLLEAADPRRDGAAIGH